MVWGWARGLTATDGGGSKMGCGTLGVWKRLAGNTITRRRLALSTAPATPQLHRRTHYTAPLHARMAG
jgi:hypothetical protein